MIISDKHKFVFVHIPKCAGTLVRKALQPFDEWNGGVDGWQKNLPGVGCVDYAHMPLSTLNNHFPGEFDKIVNYRSFALVRDPYSRFASSVAQRLKMYTNAPLQDRSKRELAREVDSIIDRVESMFSRSDLFPCDFIHFQPQIDYVFLGGNLVVGNLYPVTNVDDFLMDVSRMVGVPIESDSNGLSSRNSSVAYRSELSRRIAQGVQPFKSGAMRLGAFLPRRLRKQIWSMMLGTVYIPDNRLNDVVMSSECVKDFVKEFYMRDFELYDRAQSGHGLL